MKRFIIFLLALVLTLGLSPVHAHAEETEAPTEETAAVTEEIVGDASALGADLLLGLRWPDEWNKQKVSESEPNDFFTADFYGTDYSPNWINSGNTVIGTIGLGCYPDDTWDYFEFYVSETSTVEIVAITRYSDMTTISGTSIAYSAFEMELEKENADGRGYTTVASDSTGTYFYYTSSYQYYFSITASVQPGTYRLTLTEPKCTGSKQYNQYMCHLSVKGCEHSYKAEITPPTCTAEGYTTHTCTCGDSYVDTKVPALKHDYVNGICTRCGAEDTSTPAEGAIVTRIAGDGRCQTAMAAAEELKKIQGVSKFQTILVADGNNYPDALSGSYLAAVADAPILLIQANQKKVTQTVKEYILGNLTADATVYILGGTNSIPTDFETNIASAGYTVKRLAGNDRYLTSLMIIQEGDALLSQQGKAPADSLLVCAGGGYADSLSASATGRPVLLVNGGKTALTTSQKAYLDSIGKRSIYIIGGPNSVSNAIATQLNAYDTDGATMRIAGDGREETSAKVAQEFFPNADFAVLADGNNYPDGLSGGPVAYAKSAPLLLIRAKRESHARDYVGDRIKNGYILGGPNSVSDNSAKAIFGENAIIQ